MSHRFLLMPLFVSAFLAAQNTFPTFDNTALTFQGQINATGTDLSELTVDVRDSRGVSAGKALVTTSGEFTLSTLQSGNYVLSVLNRHGDVIATQFVTVNSVNSGVSIRLPDRPRYQSAGPATVNVQQLLHQVPKAAQKEFTHAVQFHREQKLDQAVQCLLSALVIDPDFYEAWVTLAQLQANQGKYSDAKRSFLQAVDLRDEEPQAHQGLAMVYLLEENLPDAAAEARRALAQDRNLFKCAYILGYSLLVQGQDLEEGVRQLDRAAPQFPRAHLILARYYEARGDTAKARTAAQAYLGTNAAEGRGDAEALLTRMAAAQR